ncbi:uncharacterized protein LOC111086503 [Limulus polyphemus]|uniref:Uncharacterized protein LOC111086503 n=1 Tax=Limulus polyphemus TaxID=6850 RepID=A0ABM1SNY3_LIMPO|nr:uncharacterized protein LOC111086503 [Limulus polyphemus]
MEEVYVIRLKGLPSNNSSETSSDSGDWTRDATLGCALLHLGLGFLSLVLGILGLLVEYDANYSGTGIWCGMIFQMTGISGILSWKYRHLYITKRLFLGCSFASMIAALIFFILSCFGIAEFHSIPRNFNQTARVGGNAIIAAIVELLVSVVSSLIANPTAICRTMSCINNPMDVTGSKQKIIVVTNIQTAESFGMPRSALTRHLSPNCMISLQQGDPAPDQNCRVEEFVQQDQLRLENEDYFTSSDESEWEEEEKSVSLHCNNDVAKTSDMLTDLKSSPEV